MAKRTRLPTELRMEIGKIMFDKSMSTKDVKAKYKLSDSAVYGALALYKKQNPAGRSKRSTALVVSQTNAPSPEEWNNAVTTIMQQADEIKTLNKIVLALGHHL